MRLVLMAVLAFVSLAAPARAADWTTYRYPDLAFAVAFPAAPTRLNKPQATSTTPIPTEYLYVLVDGTLYMVSSSDVATHSEVWQAPDTSARQILDGALGAGTVLSPPARLPAPAAWEGVTVAENKRTRVRGYVQGKRGYTVMIVAPVDHPERIADAAAERFFASFTPDGS
ncbi:MAG: hypothetical protein WDN45_17875 [Caulobacteraceae bacterium]